MLSKGVMGNSFSSKTATAATGNDFRDRASAAILAAFVADAATAPLQWVNDARAVDELVRKRTDGFAGPEFYPTEDLNISTSTEGATTAENTMDIGKQSSYAEEVLPLMESITRQGVLDVEDIQNEMLLYFYNCDTDTSSGNSKHSLALHHFISTRKATNSFSDCAHHTDTQFTAAMKVIVVVARYAGSPQLISKVEEVVRINHTSEVVLTAARLFARLLEKVRVILFVYALCV